MASQDLITLANARAFLELAPSDTGQDTKISGLITEASDAILRECEREFTPLTASATRRFRIRPETFLRGYYLVDFSSPVSDLRAATSVTLHPETTGPLTLVEFTDYLLEPNGQPEGVYTHMRLYPTVPITNSQAFIQFGFAFMDIAGSWGFPSVPSDVQGICKKVVRAWMRPEGAVLADFGGDSAVPPPSNAYDLPLFAKRALSNYKRRPNIF